MLKTTGLKFTSQVRTYYSFREGKLGSFELLLDLCFDFFSRFLLLKERKKKNTSVKIC